MQKNLLTLLFIFISCCALAQVPGDTIVVNTFNYGSTTRDTVINFPNNPAITYEKVIMLYNMRCKNGLVSPPIGGQTNIGCGEWDYSCNTYITDSTRVDSLLGTRPSHTVSNFSGTVYPYVTIPYFQRYQYSQTNTVQTILSETQSTVGNGTLSLAEILNANSKSGRSQFLFTQSELTAAGVTAGNIGGIILRALNASVLNFLKVNIKHSNLNSLSSATPEIGGFTDVYYSNTTFVTGDNRIQFHTPFNWDGVSNIIIDFSFTNSTPNTSLSFEGTLNSTVSGLYTNNGYHINTAGGITGVIPTAPFSSISNEITVSFWSRGDAGVSTQNTSILEGVDSSLKRQLNIHHPWSNSNVYFDCGNNGSGYDRISALATTAVMEQTWNHWTFTKNTASGIMNIYLNGVVWLTGSGKVFPINIDSLIIGTNINSSYLYKGDIDELTIWNAEISLATIQAWMNKSIDVTHPNYANLVAYYKFDEGNGATSADASVNAQTSTFIFTPDWRFTRGNQLSRLFIETSKRPNVIFLQGTYTLTNANILVYDSVQASGNLVKEYNVISNAGTSQSDAYNVVTTNMYWHASYKYLFDGVSGVKLDSFLVSPSGTITISNLPYIDRYPSKYEIMSFVTPYGINLNLGMTGKTWTFDMTDYLPILKGNKRLTMERGGEWQENMDIKFLFIVGTPVREVKNITQIWRQPGNCNFGQIMDDVYFEPRNLMLDPTGKFFKIRNTITGHGQEGEFEPRNHTFNIGGGAHEFQWFLLKGCATNPVYPQGGTWIYNRCGWCPGMASDLKEFDITPFVTPGLVANLDYHLLPLSIGAPPIGDSRYIVTNQLVTYGDMNFTLDASVVDILSPTQKVEYAREQAICAKPKIIIQNTGSTILTSLKIEYWINNNTSTRSVYNWTGSLAPLATAEVELSNATLWVNVNSVNNEFHVELKNPNGGSDQYSFNNFMNSQFVITDVMPSNVIIHCKTNLAAAETSYKLYDEVGNVILNRNGLLNSTHYRDTMNLPSGCYKLVMLDAAEDGLSWSWNSSGTGIFRLLKGTLPIKTFNPNFGASIVYNFTIDYPLKYDDIVDENNIKVYPNPTSDLLTIEAEGIEKAIVSLNNTVGQILTIPISKFDGKLVMNTTSLSKGIYFVNFILDNKKYSKKVVVE